MNKKMGLGLIGAGYWGPNLLRNLTKINSVNLVRVADLDEKNREKVKESYPYIEVSSDHQDILDDTGIDAVVIATPSSTHFDLVHQSLIKGKHVLVEKPLATESGKAGQLVKLATERKLTLMVGHTFLYNAAVRKAREYIRNSELGEILYIYGTRVNLGQVRKDVNALWNFAPHDISIANYLLDSLPISLQAFGASYIQKGIEDVVFLNMRYPQGVICSFHLSWLDPKKVRQITIVGTRKMLIYDDISSDQKIQLIDKGVEIKNKVDGKMLNFGEYQLMLRSGDTLIPRIDFVEPLQEECAHFIDCCLHSRAPLSDGINGMQIVAILEAATRSLKNAGGEIEISYPRV